MSFKQNFLKNLLLGLQLQARTSTSYRGAMVLQERKRAVKSCADVAMAAARAASGHARWPKAILASAATVSIARKVQRCRRIVRMCRGRKRSYAARRLVQRRTMALREVIPGGRDAAVDEATLLCEAMDYVVHLRAQVDVLRRVSRAVEIRSSSITLQ